LINSQDHGVGAAVTKMRVLLLSANPFGTPRLSVEEELHRIEVKVTLSKQRHLIDLIPRGAVRPDELLRYLDESLPHIVHFSGHGSAEGEIVLASDDGGIRRVAPQTLSRVFATMRRNIQVVVLNACWSAVQAKAIHEHIDWVVGMRRAINDEAAAEFAAAFYGALGFQCTVPEAFARSLLALELNGFADVDTPELLARPGAEERIRFGR
jgi:hypothetical protein